MTITAKQIKSLRRSRFWTQLDAAKHFGVTQSAWSYWESGRSTPGVKHLKKFAKILGKMK